MKLTIKSEASHVTILKRVTAKFDNQDARVDLERREVESFLRAKVSDLL